MFIFGRFLHLGLDTHLFVKLPRPGDSEGTFAVSSEAATCYYQSNYSKVEAIPLRALPKDTTSELSGLSLHYSFFMHYLFLYRLSLSSH